MRTHLNYKYIDSSVNESKTILRRHARIILFVLGFSAYILIVCFIEPLLQVLLFNE